MIFFVLIIFAVLLLLYVYTSPDYDTLVVGGWVPSKISSRIERVFGVKPAKMMRIKHEAYVQIEEGKRTAEIRLDAAPFNEFEKEQVVAVYDACFHSHAIPIKIIAVGRGSMRSLCNKYWQKVDRSLSADQLVDKYKNIYNSDDEIPMFYIQFRVLDPIEA